MPLIYNPLTVGIYEKYIKKNSVHKMADGIERWIDIDILVT